MSLDDRDWYRDLHRERAGLKPKWQLWRGNSASNTVDARHNPYYVKPQQTWHWSLILIVWVLVLLSLTAFFKYVVRSPTRSPVVAPVQRVDTPVEIPALREKSAQPKKSKVVI